MKLFYVFGVKMMLVMFVFEDFRIVCCYVLIMVVGDVVLVVILVCVYCVLLVRVIVSELL